MTSLLSRFKRTLEIDLDGNNAAFLWGPRKVGKTTFLHQKFPGATYYDLLDTERKTQLSIKPAILRQEVLAESPKLVILDEVQKVSALLDEVHWCLENTKTKFIMCGSSARKLRHGAANLLGGRAWRFELFPLTTNELKEYNLLRIMNHGLIPKHYAETNPDRSLKSYVFDYIEQEIRSEALVRNVPSFSRFLDAVSLTHGQLINYANLARDCGVSPKTAREYYQILQDTLLGHELLPWRKSKNRRLIETAKFYLFDPGVVRALSGFNKIQPRTDEFGRYFEHFLIEEIRAYLSYHEKNVPLAFWKTSTGLEVDLIIGNMDIAIEFKATSQADERDLKGLRALLEDQKVGRAMVVSLDEKSRELANNIQILPWQEFCRKLWHGEII
ncbi:MAG: AAA family ATPase [Candidatus Margulisbacteria bacterium]|nr:AAA family ATPase [Candidatus Margulisiibacteriota bacterium]